MMRLNTPEEKEAALAQYHATLNNVVALFAAYDGYDYFAIQEALDLLASNMYRYPVCASLVAEIERRQAQRKDTV